jgi:hypothetical protein
MTAWIVIENTPGYLPDSAEDPPLFEDYSDAVEFMTERCHELEDEGATIEWGWASSGNYAAARAVWPGPTRLDRWIGVELDSP